MDDTQVVTLIQRFSVNEAVKCLLIPEMGSLNNFLAFHLERSLKTNQDNLLAMYRQFYTIVSEFYHNYSSFQTVIEVFQTCESVLPGPNVDNSNIGYEFRQRNFSGEFQQDIMQTTSQHLH